MKIFWYIFVLILALLPFQSLRGEDTIKVLIVEDPYGQLMNEDTEKLGNIQGDIFLDGHIYSGLIEVRRDENGLHFINELPFDRYIEGVIAAEVGENWTFEALKAQAVISRTYALFVKEQSEGKDYHITSSVLHQVYKGNNTNENIQLSVRETKGEILTYQGQPIRAFYHSTCIGNTELPKEVWRENYPYLQSVPCKGEGSPYEHWVRRFDIEDFEAVLGIDGIKDIRIMSYTSTGRVRRIKVFAEASELEVKAVDLRRLIGYKELPSTQFTISNLGKYIIFEGSGYGHGVGLSQWGSLEMANEGIGYAAILHHYYPGAVLEKRQ
jgi:stage II sporulation protein D